MKKKYMPGKHFLQLPGPSNVPDRILRAMDYPTIDHRGPDFTELTYECLNGMKTIFKTNSDVTIFPASGTGAWEAALVNTVNEDDLVLMVETGHFASLWNKMALKLGIKTEFLETDWRRGVEPEKLFDRLKKDIDKKLKLFVLFIMKHLLAVFLE
jgi:alanine-glyoxylate transaminase/serine-glyoxylate transaminase/serine-pyruvate transaminase